MASTPQHRLRSRVACEPCRERKRKCDGASPCNTCVRFAYDCHYPPAGRKRKAAAVSARTSPVEDHVPATPIDQSQTAQNRIQSLEANSGAAFVRNLAVAVDPHNAPRLRLFAWNLFLGSRRSDHIPAARGIVEILSWADMEELSAIYFAKVDPCYGFIEHDSLKRRMQARWNMINRAEPDAFDAVLCGIAALAFLFSRREIIDEELDLVESAKHILEKSTYIHPSMDIVTAWILRVAYMRMTAPAHAAWMASCIMMHTLEAAGIHSTHILDWSGETDQALTPETRKRLLGVAQHLNIWMSFDIGRSRVYLQNIDFEPPAPIDGNYTTELLGLLPYSENLNPDKSVDVLELKTSLSTIIARHHSEPPSVLAQCNLTLLLCRRLRILNFHIQGTLLNDVLSVTARGVQAAQTLLDNCSPWHHVVNVPFQIICVLLALDTPAAIAQLNNAVTTLYNIQVIYGTDAAKEALSTACLLIHLHRKRKEADLKTLSGIVSTYSPSVILDQEFPSQPQNFSDWGSHTWLENLPELPNLQTFDIDQFLNSGEWNIQDMFTSVA